MFDFIYRSKWKVAFKTLPFVFIVILFKFVGHFLGLEFLTLNPLFAAIISANIFLIGFLVSGVLVDYKESERLPGELAVALESLIDEATITQLNRKRAASAELLSFLGELVDDIINWFHKKRRTADMYTKISQLNHHFLKMERLTQPNFIVRMKNDQSNVRRLITRAHTIRETDFTPGGYAIAEIISFILVLGFVVAKIDPFYESIFFVSFVSFILIYMIGLIRDLDNPFAYHDDTA